jgi:hypothetical protein
MTGVKVMVGVSVMVGVRLMVGVGEIVGVEDIVGLGGKNIYATGSATIPIRIAPRTSTAARTSAHHPLDTSR